MPFDIITIGSASVDYFADTDSELIRIDTRTTHEALLAFPLGEKIIINEFNTTTGGGGTNTATSFSRLGFKTAFLGKLGADVNGDIVLEKLKQENIEFIGIREGQTGISMVLNSIRDDRTILVFKGVNNYLKMSDVGALDSPWIFLSSMMGESWETVVKFLADGKFRLAFNPSSYQAAMGYEKLKVLTDKAALLIMNREEACKYLGLDYHQQVDMVKLVCALQKVAAQITIVTDAANGVWVNDGSCVTIGMPVDALKIRETTGAGDAFASTFTACYIRRMSTADCLHYAMTNAESVLQHKSAKEKLLSWQELETIARQHPRKIITVAHSHQTPG